MLDAGLVEGSDSEMWGASPLDSNAMIADANIEQSNRSEPPRSPTGYGDVYNRSDAVRDSRESIPHGQGGQTIELDTKLPFTIICRISKQEISIKWVHEPRGAQGLDPNEPGPSEGSVLDDDGDEKMGQP